MRARSLKPGLFANELLGKADPLITILFEGLWCSADRAGRLDDRPLKLCGTIFPYRRSVTEKRVHTWLQWLHDEGFITRYTVDKSSYIQINEFIKHQKPHQNERPSIIPALSSKQGVPRSTPKANQGSNDVEPRQQALGSDSGLLTPDSSLREIPLPPLGKGAEESLTRGNRRPRDVRAASIRAWVRTCEVIDAIRGTQLTWADARAQIDDPDAHNATMAIGGAFSGYKLIADRNSYTQSDLKARFREQYEQLAGGNEQKVFEPDALKAVS